MEVLISVAEVIELILVAFVFEDRCDGRLCLYDVRLLLPLKDLLDLIDRSLGYFKPLPKVPSGCD
jgi:hypothetical protein